MVRRAALNNIRHAASRRLPIVVNHEAHFNTTIIGPRHPHTLSKWAGGDLSRSLGESSVFHQVKQPLQLTDAGG